MTSNITIFLPPRISQLLTALDCSAHVAHVHGNVTWKSWEKWKEGKKGAKEEREHEKNKGREREVEDASRKTACTLAETELSDFQLQSSVLSGLILAKVK